VAAPAVTSASGDEEPKRTLFFVAQDEQPGEENREPKLRKVLTARLAAPSSHWIGIESEPVGAALRTHLKLEEGQGLLVRNVVPDSPAAQAGVQQHDVLLQFNETRLRDVPDLAKAVTEAKEQESTLRLVRGGETQEVRITPQQRPEEAELGIRDLRDVEIFHRYLPHEFRLPAAPGEEPMQMMLVRPGVVGAFAFAGGELPANSTLTITRAGEGPAKVVYTHGDKTIEITSDQLDKLPEEVRSVVKRALGEPGSEMAIRLPLAFPQGRQTVRGFRWRAVDEDDPPATDQPKPAPVEPGIRVESVEIFPDGPVKTNKEPTEGDEERDAALRELRDAIDSLRKEVEKLRERGNDDAR
jgi:membrane-associated protease RseP (regulator of RpoE activity)